MAEKLLDGSDVVSAFEEVRREGMTQSMAGGWFGDSRFAHGLTDGPLENGLVKMVALAISGFSVHVGSGSREHPLPIPLCGRSRVLRAEGIREFHVAGALLEVSPVLHLDPAEMRGEGSY